MMAAYVPPLVARTLACLNLPLRFLQALKRMLVGRAHPAVRGHAMGLANALCVEGDSGEGASACIEAGHLPAIVASLTSQEAVLAVSAEGTLKQLTIRLDHPAVRS